MAGEVKGETAEVGSTRQLKILMLHGYTQSGPLFRAKTRALEKILLKAFPAAPQPPHKVPPQPFHGVELLYPTAPIRLHPADIPGFDVSAAQGEERDAWGWWQKSDTTGEYRGLEKGLEMIREAIEGVGGVDGVVGFSQGGAAAGIVASLLEGGRKEALEKHKANVASALEYPKGWDDLRKNYGQLKFAVSYSGFFALGERYEALYKPKISTPVLHVIGSLDSVVEESRTKGLVERCVGGEERMVMHPGGHFVPVGKEMGGVLVGFIRKVIKEEKEEGSVENMDVPF